MILRVVVAYLAVLIASGWLPWPRWRGLLVAAAVIVMLAALRLTPNVLHPQDPISNSSASGIQLTFLALGLLSCIGAVWLTMFVQSLHKPPHSSSG